MRADKDILLHRYLLSNISVPFCSQEHGNKKKSKCLSTDEWVFKVW